jgi:hypothetical protein
LLTTGGGSAAAIARPMVVSASRTKPSFDLMFTTAGGRLEVTLDGRRLESIEASAPGVRRRVTIPLDLQVLTQGHPTASQGMLRFELSGKPGAGVQLSDVVIPGAFADSMAEGSLARWQIDASRGGAAAVVDTTRFPVKLQVDPGESGHGRSALVVTVFSDDELDAATAIVRSTLRVNGVRPRMKRDHRQPEHAALTGPPTTGQRPHAASLADVRSACRRG